MDHLTDINGDQLQVAAFYSRFFAVLLDAIILFIPLQAILYVLDGSGKPGILIGQVLSVIIFIIYHIYLITRFGATPGKMMMKIKVVRSDGESPEWREALLRRIVTLGIMIVSLAIFLSVYQRVDYASYLEMGVLKKPKFLKSYSSLYEYVSYLSVIWGLSDLIYYFANGRNKALHDQIAATLVIRANPYRILGVNLKITNP